MPKYSFIVPVYNTEKYLKKCLDSILNQTFKDFEVIVINDGSTDNSLNIIKEYSLKDKRIRYYDRTNVGLSETRNFGVSICNGKYITFVDSDDYIEKELLEKISKINSEVIRIQLCTEDENNKLINNYEEEDFKNLSGEEAFNIVMNYKFVETACVYFFEKNFYLKNNFKFEKGKYHEDFGLIPLIIIKANNVTSINYIGYHYIQRNGSIMNNDIYNKQRKKSYDTLFHFINAKNKIKTNLYKNINATNMMSFMANSTILKARNLKKDDYKNYVKELKNNNVFDYVLTNTLIRKIKKIIMKVNLKLYLKVSK